MDEKQCADQEAGKGKSIAHFLDDWTSRAKGRRRDV